MGQKLNARLWATLLLVASGGFLLGCGAETPQSEAPDTAVETPTAETATGGESEEEGILEVRASGEDLAVEGLTSKDGWELSFDHIYVTFDEVTAFQSDPPFDAQAGGSIQAVQEVRLPELKTVDLTADPDEENSVLIDEVAAPAGRYNALSWQMARASDGPAAGYSMVLQGTATQEGETVDFTLKMSPEFTYTCGDFIGDERKGILEANGMAGLQATFHLDHLFGDAGAAEDDSINLTALGFDPLANLAEDGVVDVSTDELAELLSSEEYALLTDTVIPELGHVGEGHCQVSELSA